MFVHLDVKSMEHVVAYLICHESSSWYGVLCLVILIAKSKALSWIPSCQVVFVAWMLLLLWFVFDCLGMCSSICVIIIFVARARVLLYSCCLMTLAWSALSMLVLVPLPLHSYLDVELMASPMFSYHFSSYWHLTLHVVTSIVAWLFAWR